MKVLAITTSGRRDGNVNNVCEKLLEGAKSAGHDTEMINLHDYNVKHCIGCLGCTKTRKCMQKDDFETIFNKESEADVIVIGAPIYVHNVPGILKDFIDRSCSAVIPYINVRPTDRLLDKIKSASKYIRGFKTNAPFKTKRIITILACNNPNSDFKEADKQIKNFADEMGSKITNKIRCADTLFKLKPKAIDKIYKKAFSIGKSLEQS